MYNYNFECQFWENEFRLISCITGFGINSLQNANTPDLYITFCRHILYYLIHRAVNSSKIKSLDLISRMIIHFIYQHSQKDT